MTIKKLFAFLFYFDKIDNLILIMNFREPII